jgi:hypothetical protein
MLGPFAATQGGTCVLHGPLARGASCTIVLNLSWGPQGGLRQGRLDVGFLHQNHQSVDIFVNVLAGVIAFDPAFQPRKPGPSGPAQAAAKGPLAWGQFGLF